MAKVIASIPQGTRDFGPETVRKRNYIFNTIRTVFELYGFQPLETPAMENIETLMGKYGDEGDKLIFRMLDSGNPFSSGFFKELSDYLKFLYEDFEKYKNEKGDTAPNPYNNPLWEINADALEMLSGYLIMTRESGNVFLPTFKNKTSGKALRYDLTIPFARYVAMNYGQLTMPFKRYQMQPVWRADRPQKGRYREFYQCDADVVGSTSLINEAELAIIYATVFEKLGIAVEIKINSRKILAALAEICGGADQLTNITIAIDKLDKIGIEKVKAELSQRGLTDDQITIIEKYLAVDGSNENKLQKIKELVAATESGKKGIEELEFLLGYNPPSTHRSALSIDFTLARGLNYYTGIIFEVKASNIQMGSIGGGGRYDDLTGTFGLPNVPGVGISFGVDRIYDVMEELKLFPDAVQTGTRVLFFNLGEAESKTAFTLMQQLRGKNISCELYPESTKFDKQFKYAEKKNMLYVIIIGSKELADQSCTIKNLQTGQQETIAQSNLHIFNF